MAKPDHQSTMLGNMNECRRGGKFCDFKIIVEGQAVLAHRVVLCSASSYFRTMIAIGFVEAEQGQCELRDVTFRGVSASVELIYMGTLELKKETVAEILQVCHIWQLQNGIQICKEFLIKNLDVSTCIQYRKLFAFYDLNDESTDLIDECNWIIFDNIETISKQDEIGDLTITEVDDLINSEGGDNASVRKLWEFCANWSKKLSEKSDNHDAMCQIVAIFPFDKFSIWTFKACAWENVHVVNCEKCQQNVAEKFLGGFVTLDKYFNVDVARALFVKKLAKAYKYPKLEEIADEYIVKHHHSLFTSKEFLKVDKDDLLQYVARIDPYISTEDVPAIVNWMKEDPSRHEVFPELFQHTLLHATMLEHIQGKSFTGNASDCSTSCSSVSSEEQLSSFWPEDCFFLKSLAQRYDCKGIEREIDKGIIRGFAKTSTLKEFVDLHLTNIITFLRDPELYNADGEVIWNSVTRWLEHDAKNRNECFPQLFEAMRLEEFSTSFLKEIVVNHSLVKESPSCASRLLMVAFGKISEMERDHDRRIRILESRERKRRCPFN